MKSLNTALQIHAGVKGINELKKLSDEIKATGTATDSLDKATDELQKSWKSLSTDEQARKVKELGNEFKGLHEIAKAKIALGIDEDEKAKRQLQEINQAFIKLKASGTLTQSELARASQLHTQKVAELEKQLGITTNASQKASLSLSELAGAGTKLVSQLGGIAVISKQAMGFETAMAGVKKVVDGTPEQMGELSNKIKELSVNLGMTAEDVASIAALGGQLGVPIDELDKFTQMAGKMAVAFDMSAEEAGNAAAKLANVFGLPITEVESLGDAINTLGNNTAAKEKEIVEAMLRIGGTAKQFGLAGEEAAALAASLISLGKSPEVAATGINALLTKLQTAQSAGADFQNALNSIGLSADELADSIAKNPQAALSGFLTKLSELDDRQRSMVSVKLFGAEYADDINALVGSLGTYNNALGLTADKSKMAGAMGKEFDAQMNTTAKRVAQAKAELANLAITLGQHLLPIISTTAEGFGDIVGAVNELATTYPTLTQLAVIIGSGMVAIRAFNGVLTLTSGIGLKAGADIARSFLTAELAINSTARATQTLGVELESTSTKTGKLEGAFGRLNQLMAIMASYELGNAIGSWAYENIDLVQTLGDHLASIPAAVHSIATTGSLDQFVENFEMGTSRAKDLKNAIDETKTATNELSQAQTANSTATTSQTQANTELLNNITLLSAELEQMEARLAQMGMAGEKGTTGYQKLQAEIDNTKTKLAELKTQADQQGLGEALKSDIEKAEQAFKDLGLDMNEFATGIDTKTKTALSAFSQVAQLAGDNVDKLALAYGAAQSAAGNNATAQAELNGRLLEAVNGNTTLAQSIKDTAAAQQLAKQGANDHAKALAELGINMNAINAGMSDGGQKIANSLGTALIAIKETATGADALKVALSQAFDTAIKSAQTKNDFVAIKTAIEQAGMAGQLTSQQLQILNAGMQGGAVSAKEAKTSIDALNKSTTETATAHNSATNAVNANTQAKQANTSVVNTNTQAKQANTAATKEAETAHKGLNLETGKTGRVIELQSAAYNQMATTLLKLGASTDEVRKAIPVITHFNAVTDTGAENFNRFMQKQAGYANQLAQQAQSFEELKQKISGVSGSLSGAELSTKSLANAQTLLNKGISASVGGIVQLDKSTLDNLKNQIAQARQQLQSLAQEAKNTADNLESELARMQGNDKKAQEIENTQKLTELENKLQQARARGNLEEINQLQRALSLQKQINTEKIKQVSQKSQSKSTNSKSSQSTSDTISASEVAGALINTAKQEAINSFAKQLVSEAKRMAS